MPSVIHGSTAGDVDTSLEYDASGTRVAKRGPTETTLYGGDLYECVGQSTADGSITCT